MVTNLYLINTNGKYNLCYIPKDSIDEKLHEMLKQSENISLEDLTLMADAKRYKVAKGKLKPSLEYIINLCEKHSVNIENKPTSKFIQEFSTGQYDNRIKSIIKNKQTKIKRIYNFFNHYKKRVYFSMENFALKFQKNNTKALTSTIKTEDINLLYSPNLSKEQAISLYNNILKKEWRKNVIMLAINSILLPVIIPLGWLTPLAVVPATSVPFVLMWYHSFNVLRSIRNKNKHINFVPNENVKLLETAISNNDTTMLNNEELIKCYEMVNC